jgi:hypothetical protein
LGERWLSFFPNWCKIINAPTNRIERMKMDPLNVLLVLGVVVGFCILLLVVLAFLTAVLSAYHSFDEAYDDLHSEKDYLDDYKAKRSRR